jgi:hypothetical protein
VQISVEKRTPYNKVGRTYDGAVMTLVERNKARQIKG